MQPSTDERSISLAEEARYLHKCLFRIPLAPEVVTRYEAAHTLLFPDERQSTIMARIVSRKLDPEAVEFALRHRGLGMELTRKMQVLFYIVEVRAAYQHEFLNHDARPTQAAFAVAVSVIRSLWKLIKGGYLIRRHGLLHRSNATS